MNIRPLHDRVVVRRKEEETTTASGIVLPGSASEKPTQGVVLAVGTGRIQTNGEVTPLAIKEGDTIIFGQFSGQTVKLNGEDLLIMKEDEVYGILEA
jgi:chaperonin GroES